MRLGARLKVSNLYPITCRQVIDDHFWVIRVQMITVSMELIWVDKGVVRRIENEIGAPLIRLANEFDNSPSWSGVIDISNFQLFSQFRAIDKDAF